MSSAARVPSSSSTTGWLFASLGQHHVDAAIVHPPRFMGAGRVDRATRRGLDLGLREPPFAEIALDAVRPGLTQRHVVTRCSGRAVQMACRGHCVGWHGCRSFLSSWVGVTAPQGTAPGVPDFIALSDVPAPSPSIGVTAPQPTTAALAATAPGPLRACSSRPGPPPRQPDGLAAPDLACAPSGAPTSAAAQYPRRP